MVIRLFFIFIICINSATTFGQTNCKSVKKGFFFYKANENESYIIRRKNKKQIEWNLQKKEKVVTEIQWLTDCVYRLTYLSSSAQDTTSITDIPITIRIEKVEEDHYDFIISSLDELFQKEGEIIRIKRKAFKKYLRSCLKMIQ